MIDGLHVIAAVAIVLAYIRLQDLHAETEEAEDE